MSSHSRSHGGHGWMVRLVLVSAAVALAVFQFTLLHQAHLQHAASMPTLRQSFLQDFATKSISKSRQKSAIKLPKVVQSPRPDYYMVFSTSCSPQQNWESYVFFFHAMKVFQPGSVTRIASACNEEQTKQLQTFHNQFIAPMGNFHIHFTPDYSRVNPKDTYKYFNKPFGLLHWLQNGLGLGKNATSPALNDAIVMLLDPDMVLLRPMTHDFTSRDDIEWIVDDQHPEPATKVVRHGFPIAQQDGYLNNQWMALNLTYIVNGPVRQTPDPVDGPRIWNSGPPYMATVKDMYAMALKWVDFVPRVHHVYPDLYAEMFGLITATVQLNLPFTMTRSLVVSEPVGMIREIWRYIDALPDKDVCNPPISTVPWPLGLHYCQRYNLGKWFFSKYRMKKSIMDCNQQLLSVPPVDVAIQYDYRAKPPFADGSDLQNYTPHKVVMDRIRIKRHGFMLCHMTRAVNEALIYYKRLACGSSANLNKTWDIYTDPSDK